MYILYDTHISKVGQFTDGDLNLDFTRVRDYEQGTELQWPNLRKARCQTGEDCTECYSESDLHEGFNVDPGDAYVVGTNHMFVREGASGCGGMSTMNTYEVIEAMRFAVQKINNDNLYFPSMRIGTIIMCTCNNPVVVQRKLYNLLRDGLTFANGFRLVLQDKIVGFVGDIGSSISIAMAEVLTRVGHVQISYASTSPTLR